MTRRAHNETEGCNDVNDPTTVRMAERRREGPTIRTNSPTMMWTPQRRGGGLNEDTRGPTTRRRAESMRRAQRRCGSLNHNVRGPTTTCKAKPRHEGPSHDMNNVG